MIAYVSAYQADMHEGAIQRGWQVREVLPALPILRAESLMWGKLTKLAVIANYYRQKTQLFLRCVADSFEVLLAQLDRCAQDVLFEVLH